MLLSPHCDVRNITDSLSALRGFKLSRSRSIKSLMVCLEPFVAAFLSSTSVQSLSRFNGLSVHTQDMWQKGTFRMFEAPINLTIMSFADGATLWAGEPGEHLLHERHSTVSAVRARAQDGTQEVAQNIYCRLNRFRAFAHSGIFLHRQVLGSPAIHRTKRTVRLYHSSSSWLVRDHGQDLLEPPTDHLTAVRPHGLSTVCWEGRPGTVPAAGEDPEVDVALQWKRSL